MRFEVDVGTYKFVILLLIYHLQEFDKDMLSGYSIIVFKLIVYGFFSFNITRNTALTDCLTNPLINITTIKI